MSSVEQATDRLTVGRVISKKSRKTAVVYIERFVQHKRYGKYISRSKKFHIHDELDQCQEGDIVSFVKTRPYSKLKHWALVSVIQKANTESAQEA